MDTAYLLELAGGDRTVVKEILDDFLASDAADRQALAAAVAARSASDIHQSAHRIKGAARAIGATAYADTAAVVENAASTGADIGAMVQALELEARTLSEWVAAFE